MLNFSKINVFITFISCLLIACESKPPSQANGQEQNVESQTPTQPSEVQQPEQQTANLVDPQPQTEEQITEARALVSATQAAESAPRGSDTCETAVNGLTSMLEVVESETGKTMPRPEREDFLTVCRRFPPAAQQCLVPTYAMEHQEECDQTLRALPPDQLHALQSALQTAPNE